MTRTKSFTTSPVRNAVYILIIVVSVLLIYFLTVRQMRFFLVPSNSMAPTLHPRDYLLTLSDNEYNRGDIIVLEDPEAKGEYLVKRIVGVAGDTVAVEGGALTLNQLYASEPYMNEPMEYRMAPYTVPEDHVFILGDNRNHSSDSHSWSRKGFPIEGIVGRVNYIYLPLERMRKVRSYPLTNLAGG